MRLFISHCINDSQQRPDAYRDSAETVAALKNLGEELVRAGHRVFEYQHHRTESRTADILEMMNWQIRLADAVILVVSRKSYEAPGWTVPELFLANVLGKNVLCVALGEGRGFTSEQFGDVVSGRRYRSLLPAGVAFPDVDTLLCGLEKLPQRSAPRESGAPDAFDLVDLLCAWAEDGHGREKEGKPASIERFLDHYSNAWASGFRPARLFLKAAEPPSADSARGWLMERVSHWLDDRHVVVVWQMAKSRGDSVMKGKETRRLTLLDVRNGRHTMALAPEGFLYTAGTTCGGSGLVAVSDYSQEEPGMLMLERFEDTGGLGARSHAFSAALPEAVRCSGGLASVSGVLEDCWFAGSTLLRILWDEQRLEEIVPQPQDWVRFSHLGWREAAAHTKTDEQSSGKPIMVRFPGQHGQWTLLPSDWQYLCGEQGGTAGLLLAWKQQVLAFGTVDLCPSFGSDLPEIQTLPDLGGTLDHMVTEPPFLYALRSSRSTPAEMHPLAEVGRVEAEDALVIEWFGLAPKAQAPLGRLRQETFSGSNSCLFRFRAERQAMIDLKRTLLSEPVSPQ